MTVGGLIEGLKNFDPETRVGITLECIDEYFDIGVMKEANEGRVVLIKGEDSSIYDLDFEDYISIYTGKKHDYFV